MLISLAEYAEIHGRDPATVRQMALRGGFQTARKIGRNWVIEDYEAYPDHRKKVERNEKNAAYRYSTNELVEQSLMIYRVQ